MTKAEFIRIALDARLMDLHTAMPGRVEKYDASEQKADIKPQIKRAVPNGQGGFVLEELPVLPNVRVGHPEGGGFFVSFPLKKGDYVWVMFAERSLDAWRRTGEPTDPGDLRMHSLAGAYCIPGCAPTSGKLADASADNLVIGKDGTSGAQIVITPTMVKLGGGGEFVALSNKVDNAVSAIVGYINGHTHPVSGGTASAPSTPLDDQDSVAAQNVKAT